MQIERTKNALRNIFWGVIEKICSLLLPFVVRTIIINALGAEYLGLSSLFTAILSVLSISELGFGTAIVFSMYKPIAENDNAMLCALLNTYRKIYQIIGTIILTVGLLLLPFINYFIKGDVPADVNVYILYLIYLINTSISYYLYGYKGALFSAYQRGDLVSKRAMLINLFSNLLQIFFLLLFKNYYVYVIVIPLSTIASNLANAYLANKMFPNIVCNGKITKEVKNGLKKRIVGLLSFKIYGVIFNSVDSIVISSFLGLTQLAKYNNYYYIQTSIIAFLNIITGSITAGIGNKMVTNSVEDNYKDFKKFIFANAWITSWCSVCLLCLYQHFVEIWVGKDLLLPVGTMFLLVLLFFLPRVSCLTFTYREAAGLWWEDRFRPLVSTVVNLVLNLILVQFIGLNGVIISTLLCTAFINIPWGSVILFKNYFKKSPIEFFGRVLFYIIVFGAVGSITYFICNLLPNVGWIFLIIKAGICIVLPNILFYIIYRKMTEYTYFKLFINSMMNKFFRKRSKL